MPKIDSSAAEVQDFVPPPVGEYLCEVTEIEEQETQGGDPMWKLKLEIQEGEQAGKLLFDNIVFSDKAMPRAKMIVSRFGFDVSEDLDIEVDDLLNKQAIVVVDRIEEYTKKDETTGRAARVAFAGYKAIEGQEATPKVKSKAPVKTVAKAKPVVKAPVKSVGKKKTKF